MTINDPPPHELSAERIKAGAEALGRFAQTYLETPELDVSPLERANLAVAAERVDAALECFS